MSIGLLNSVNTISGEDVDSQLDRSKSAEIAPSKPSQEDVVARKKWMSMVSSYDRACQ